MIDNLTDSQINRLGQLHIMTLEEWWQYASTVLFVIMLAVWLYITRPKSDNR